MTLFDSPTRCWCGRFQIGDTDTEKEIYICKGCNKPEEECDCEYV